MTRSVLEIFYAIPLGVCWYVTSLDSEGTYSTYLWGTMMEHGLNFDKTGQNTCLRSDLKLHLQQCHKYYGLYRSFFQKHWQRYLVRKMLQSSSYTMQILDRFYTVLESHWFEFFPYIS